MNLLKLTTMILWFAMSMAMEYKNAEKNLNESRPSTIDDNISMTYEEKSITDPEENEYDELSQKRYNNEKAASIVDLEYDPEQHNVEEVEAPKTLEKFAKFDSQEVAPKEKCSLCEMDVIKDNCVQCDTCGELQKIGDKVLGNNDCHCYGRCGNHHCANCSKKIWGKDLYEGEKIVRERPAGSAYVKSLLIDDELNLRGFDVVKVPEKCDECQSGQHWLNGNSMHLQKNGIEICDECRMMKKAKEQQRREKEIPSEAYENHGTGERAPQNISLNYKTEKVHEKAPEDSTFKTRTVFIIVAVLGIILFISIGACCKKKPRKRSSKVPREKEIIVREVRSQTGKIHVIHV